MPHILEGYKAVSDTPVASVTVAADVLTISAGVTHIRIYAYTNDVLIKLTDGAGAASLSANGSDKTIPAGGFIDLYEFESFIQKERTKISAIAKTGTASLRIYEYTSKLLDC